VPAALPRVVVHRPRSGAPPSIDAPPSPCKLDTSQPNSLLYDAQTCLPHYRESWFIDRAVERHRQFLHLHRASPGNFIVPAYDMDLVWHTHMVRGLQSVRTSFVLPFFLSALTRPVHRARLRHGPRVAHPHGEGLQSVRTSLILPLCCRFLMACSRTTTPPDIAGMKRALRHFVLSLQVYFGDCEALFGSVFPHNDSVNCALYLTSEHPSGAAAGVLAGLLHGLRGAFRQCVPARRLCQRPHARSQAGHQLAPHAGSC